MNLDVMKKGAMSMNETIKEVATLGFGGGRNREDNWKFVISQNTS